MKTNHTYGALAALVALAGGCFGDSSEPTTGGGRTELPGATTPATAMLLQASGCPDLLSKIKADVIAKIDAQALLLKEGQQYAGGVAHGGVTRGAPVGRAAVDFDTSAPSAQPGAASGAAGASGSLPPSAPADDSFSGNTGATGGSEQAGDSKSVGASPTGHSETNTQVQGVDEADIVKLDEAGEKLYLVHGNTLFVLAAWPPESTNVEASLPIEGTANELFVAGGKVVVFSTLWNQGDIVALKDSQSGSSGLIGADYYYQPYYYGAPFTKVTSIDVSGEPEVERELFVEGSYLSSRRHDDTVRMIVQGGFHTPPVFSAYIEYQDPWGEDYPQEEIDAQVDAWRSRLVESIEQTELSDWVPVERERKDGVLVEAKPRCLDFYAPPPALSGYGLTNIVSFDMSDPQSDLSGAIVLGNADTVYANDATLVLAQRDWRYTEGFIEREQTVLHSFALDGARTTYRASGFVPGHIVNQFAIDAQGETLRIATTQNIWQDFVMLLPLKTDDDEVPQQDLRTRTDNRVIALQAQGDALARVGITGPIGEDGEAIQSARFVGDKGYVVTFETHDPLVVVDLADPEKLKVLGSLTIPGFSEYMHPIGDGSHLLTIGRNTDVSGFDIGLMLQIFDVSDPLAPARTAQFRFEPSGYSEASNNHKAFTYWVPEGEQDGLLAFPYVNYMAGFSSRLEVFRVSTDGGFTQLGEIDHTAFFNRCYDTFGNPGPEYWSLAYCEQPEVRRGLFVQDESEVYVYSVSLGGVLAHSLQDLAQRLGGAALPAPDYGEHRLGTTLTDDTSSPTTVGGTSAGSPGGTAMTAPPAAVDAGVAIEPQPAPAGSGG